MQNLQRGFIVPLLLALIAVLLIGGGVYIYENKITEAPAIVDTVTQQPDQVQQQTSTQTKTSGDKYFIYSDNLIDFENIESQVFSYSFTTGKSNRLSASTVTSALYPAYAPTASLVAYFLTSDKIYRCKEFCNDPIPKYKLIVQNILTETILSTETDSDANSHIVVFSANGQKLAYYTVDKKIAILNLIDKSKKFFAISPVATYTSDIVWDKNNSSIYYLNGGHGQILKLNTGDGSSSVVYENKEKLEIKKIGLTPDGLKLVFILNDTVGNENLYSNEGDEYMVFENLADLKIAKHLLESNKNRSAQFLATNGLNSVDSYVITSDGNLVYFQATDEEMYVPATNRGVLPGIKSFNVKTGEIKIIRKETGMLLGFGKDENELLVVNSPYVNSKEQAGLYSLNLINNALKSITSSPVSATTITPPPPTPTSGVVTLSGPTSLAVGQAGTWAVAKPGATRFAVIWADGTPVSVGEGSGIPYDSEFTTSPSFTHTFSKPGTYFVQFFAKVLDGTGNLGFKGLEITVQ